MHIFKLLKYTFFLNYHIYSFKKDFDTILLLILEESSPVITTME